MKKDGHPGTPDIACNHACSLILSLMLLLSNSAQLYASGEGYNDDETSLLAAVSQAAVEKEAPLQPHYSSKDERDVRLKNYWLMTGYSLAIAAYGYNAWWGDRSADFHTTEEGWFGQNTYRGGADKFGHAYFTYATSRLLTRAFEKIGNQPDRARRLASLMVATNTLAIEILDGYTEEFGFSYEDLVMDLGGIGLAWLMESRPELDDIFDYRMQYWPSDDARQFNEDDPVLDYSGQTYLFIIKASGFPALKKNKILRYLELALGYGTRGYRPTDGSLPRERFVFYGLSINMSQLLDDSLFKSRKRDKWQGFSHGFFEYVQIPGTAALADIKL